MRLSFRSLVAAFGLLLAVGSGAWLSDIRSIRHQLSDLTLHGYHSAGAYSDESRKLCVFESTISNHVLAAGDVITIDVSVRNKGYYLRDRIEQMPNPYYGAPPAPKVPGGTRGGSGGLAGGLAYDHTREVIEKRTEVIDPVALECTARLSAPGFTPGDGELTVLVPFGESRVLGSWSLEASSAGYKVVTVHTNKPNVFDRYQVEVRESHLGLPLWAEEWGARALVFLGPMLTLPWWVEWWRRRRSRTPVSDRPPTQRPVLERLRGRR